MTVNFLANADHFEVSDAGLGVTGDAVTDERRRLSSLLALAEKRFAEAGIDQGVAEAELIAGHTLGLTRGAVVAQSISGMILGASEARHFLELVNRRVMREPLQHITGTAYFRNLELSVGPGVFVPRPETEVLVDRVIDTIRTRPTEAPVVVDLGTGSGAVAWSIASEVPQSTVVATELSPAAFTWAKTNLHRLGLTNASLVRADFAGPLPASVEGVADIVVSNPPYIPVGMVPRDPEVRHFDPELALFSGADGLDAIRTIVHRGKSLLAPGGSIFLEHAEHQGQAVREILSGAGWNNPATAQDLTGRDRVTSAQLGL